MPMPDHRPSVRPRRRPPLHAIACLAAACLCAAGSGASAAEQVEKTSFSIDVNPEWGRDGGLIAYDLNADGQRDLLITQPGRIVAYELSGEKLWRRDNTNQQLGGQSEANALPGLHGPGIQVGDLDGDDQPEVIYIAKDNTLSVLDGPTGETERTIQLPQVDSHFDRWEHAIISNFRGEGPRDLLLQASVDLHPGDGTYLRDKIVAAFAAEELFEKQAQAEPLWRRNDYIGPSHGTARVIDLNKDGRDEVVGGTVIGPDGKLLLDTGIPDRASPHIDSLAIGDIHPGHEGLEAVVPEEAGAKRVILFSRDQVIWVRPQEDFTDGDKVQVGRFDPDREGLQIFLRGADANDMRLYDHTGELLTHYQFDEASEPESWTDEGIEDIFRIRWTGGRDHLAVKGRHAASDAGILDPRTAKFLHVFDESASRIYVADLLGDWREELLAVSGDQLTIYQNTAENPNPDHPSLWNNPAYRRMKMTWNYYSP